MKKQIYSGCCNVNRRGFLVDCGMGFVGLALGAMLYKDGIARPESANLWRPPDGNPHFSPQAKNVIWIFMIGGVSHLESFDPKPALNKYGGMTIGDSPYKDTMNSPHIKNIRIFNTDNEGHMPQPVIFPLQVGYRKRGESGIEISDWWPNVGECIDDIAVVRSMWTTDNNHGAQLQFHTGRHVLEGAFPTIGSWVHYGLGSLNDNLPQFVVLGNPVDACCGGEWSYGSSYLGPEHAGVRLAVDPENPLPFVSPGPDVYPGEQEREFELLRELNGLAGLDYPDDSSMRARIKSYELAFRMQTAVPELLQFKEESEATRKLYGLDQKHTKSFAHVCLTARRLVERGVRFVQIFHGQTPMGSAGAWDAHSNLKATHTELCAQVDQPIAALVRDLKQRGLLEDTLVVWASEFGRTCGVQGTEGGRDHSPYGFSVWLAGGGIKGGSVHGATDELGFHAIENRHYVTDIHATVLHQLGLDVRKLEVPGRKLIEMDIGHPIKEIIAWSKNG